MAYHPLKPYLSVNETQTIDTTCPTIGDFNMIHIYCIIKRA